MADQGVKLFLSCVSDEFGAYRDELRRKLTRPNVEVKIQEDFKALGGDTLSMLEEYIEHCDAVVHFAGDMTGSAPKDFGVAELLARRPDLKTRLPPLGAALDAGARISYTQWEAWLALYFRKDLVIAAPGAGLRPRSGYRGDEGRPRKRKRLISLGCARLAAIRKSDSRTTTISSRKIFASAVIKALVKAEAMPARQPRNLPFASLGPLFMGRDDDLRKLHEALAGGAPVALTGLGGVGKTRLAIEYALEHGDDKSALLMARADNPSTLEANLAALAGAKVLDLKEQEAPQDSVKVEAALRWLEAHPTWLMILDNVDDEDARDAVVDLLARLNGGRVVITARAANFPASVLALELGVLDEDAATAFLMDRTRGKRAQAADDPQQARALAHELGGLALGLEQAGAYIAAKPRAVSFAGYLKLWRDNREKALKWFDPKLMAYAQAKGLAATWETSVNRLSPESRRLLERLAMLAPDPVPNSLIDVAVPGEAADTDALEALAGLYAYSLVTPATAKDGSGLGFVMHRLVQDFARRAMTDERRGEALREALGWVDDAFVGDPQDVRSWPVLDPLAPHALAVARRADEAGIAEPTGRLFNQLGLLFRAKARFAEAEPLISPRRLTIDEASFGQRRIPIVAIGLNNLAQLLQRHEPPRRGRAAHAPRARDRRGELRGGSSQRGDPPQQSRGIAARHEPPRRGRAAHAPRARNRRGELRGGSSQRGDRPQQSRATAASHEPPRRGRAAHAPRARDRRGELRGGSPQRGERTSTISRNCCKPRTASARPSRSCAARSQSTRRASGRIIPTWRSDLNNLARLLQATNRLGEAEPLMRRALAILREEPGAGSSEHGDRAPEPRRARCRAQPGTVSGGGPWIATALRASR